MSTYPDPHTGGKGGHEATRRARRTEPAGKMLFAGALALAVIVAVVLLLT